MKTTWLIGQTCKYGNVFSELILISRGLNLMDYMVLLEMVSGSALFGFQGTIYMRL